MSMKVKTVYEFFKKIMKLSKIIEIISSLWLTDFS